MPTQQQRRLTPLAFTPRQLPGVRLWLDAGTIAGVADAGSVAAWPDSSGQGVPIVQATNAPTYKVNIVKGRPVVRNVSANDTGMVGPVGTFCNVPLTIAAVYQSTDSDGVIAGQAHQSTSGLNSVLYKDGGNTVMALVQNAGNKLTISGAATGAVFKIAVLTLVGSNASFIGQIWINGASIVGPTAGSGATGITTSFRFTIGFLPSTGFSPAGADIAEVVICDGVLSDEPRQRLEAFWNARYGLY
jgi:hypothetical protein